MKILMVIPYLGSTYGGTSESVRRLAHSLGALGLDVDIVTSNANGTSKLAVPLRTWIQETGYRIQFFPCWHRSDLIFCPSLLYWLINHVADYQLIHTHTVFSPLILVAHGICKSRQVPYIATPHGMLEPWALAHKAWKKRVYYHLFERALLRQAAAIHATSSVEKGNIQALNLQPEVILIPNGIGLDDFQDLPDPELFYQQFPTTGQRRLLLFLGRIDPKKGLDLLAPAFAQVHQCFPDTHLIVAGPDTIGFLPTARNFFAQAGCLEAVTFTGMLTGALKLAALAAASLYVAPTYSEGFSVSVLEGMACGLPCVITRGCNFPEAAVAGVAYVVDIEAPAIATALIQCLQDPEAARAMGDRARDFIFRNYTWHQAAERLLQAIQQINSDPQAPDNLPETYSRG